MRVIKIAAISDVSYERWKKNERIRNAGENILWGGGGGGLVAVSLWPPQTLCGLSWDWTGISAVRDLWLIICIMLWTSRFKFEYFLEKQKLWNPLLCKYSNDIPSVKYDMRSFSVINHKAYKTFNFENIFQRGPKNKPNSKLKCCGYEYELRL
jgi:hypothetical protein